MILNLCHFCHVDCELYLKSGSKAITPENFFGILLYEVVTIIYTYVFVYVLTYSHHFLEQNSKQIKYLDGKERKQNYDGGLLSNVRIEIWYQSNYSGQKSYSLLHI